MAELLQNGRQLSCPGCARLEKMLKMAKAIKHSLTVSAYPPNAMTRDGARTRLRVIFNAPAACAVRI